MGEAVGYDLFLSKDDILLKKMTCTKYSYLASTKSLSVIFAYSVKKPPPNKKRRNRRP
jgi:hypothetical protein